MNHPIRQQHHPMLTMCITVFLFFSWLWITPTFAVEPNPSYNHVIQNIQLEYLRDASLTKKIHQVRHSNDWQDTKKRAFGLGSDIYWFRFTIPASTTLQQILEVRYPFLDDIQVCIFRQNKLIDHFYAGQRYPFQQWPIQFRNPSFSLSLSTTEATEVYLRVKNDGFMQIPLKLWSKENFNQYQKTDGLLQGFFIGVLLIIIFYSFVLFMTMHYIEYFHYSLFLGCFLSLICLSSGLGFQFIWPKHIHLSSTLLIITLMLTTTSACLLKIAYLKRKNTPHTLFPKLLRGLVIASSIVIMLTFLAPYNVVLSACALLVFLTNICLLGMSTYALKQHGTSIYYYTICWLIILLLMFYQIGSKFGFIPISIADHYLLQFTSLIAACLLSFILQKHILSERSLRRSAEQETKHLEEKQAVFLEDGIKERTKVLEESIQTLSTANAELSRINQFDSLTNVFNRHCFNMRYKQLVQRAIEDKEILSMIIIDIDHFKHFNDNFGHHTGDQCLRKVAQTLQAEIHRSEDMLFRYGGEEFVIILPNTINRGSFTIAERMRIAIENIHFMVDGKHVPITISGGVASLYLHHEEDAHTLFNFADTALYEAKNTGRNRVHIFTL